MVQSPTCHTILDCRATWFEQIQMYELIIVEEAGRENRQESIILYIQDMLYYGCQETFHIEME